MDQISAYSSLLVPGAVAIVLLIALVKVVSAIVKLVTIVAIIALLVGGFTVYGRISAIQSAANAVASASGGYTSSLALANAVTRSARKAAAELGLNPAYLHVRLLCVASRPQVRLRYADDSFMFGILSQQAFTVPLSTDLRCQ